MRTATVLLVLLALALPAVAMPHPCELEVARMKKDLEAIHGAIATIEAVPPSGIQRHVLAGAKGKYDLESRRQPLASPAAARTPTARATASA